MNSKKVTQKSAKQPLQKRPPYKFLLRTLKISNQDIRGYRIVFVKRFYFKRLIDPREELQYDTDDKLVSRVFKNIKGIRTLQSAHMNTFLEPYAIENLKHSKNLKKFHLSLKDDDFDENPYPAAVYLKHLPINIQMIRFDMSQFTPVDKNQELKNIAKCIRRYRKLKYFRRWNRFEAHESKNHLSKELQIYNQSASRLKEARQISYYVSHYEQMGLQRAMRRGFVYPGITGLRIALQPQRFPHYNQMLPFFYEDSRFHEYELFDFDNMTPRHEQIYQRIQADIQREDAEGEIIGNPREEVNSETSTVSSDSFDERFLDEEVRAECIMREEIKPFYRFECFPNLKKLVLTQLDFGYPLDSFVVDGFKALKKLESLKIIIAKRSMGTSNIFKGFLCLPMLKEFSLHIDFIKSDDWILLEQFLKDQNNLESLNLSVTQEYFTRQRYILQNDHLEKIIMGIQNKPFLKCLDLKSHFWPLEAISKGLSHLNLTNQLESFGFGGFDDTITSTEKLWKRVEGICKFIKSQKDSLKDVKMALTMALEENLVIHLAEAISKITHLRNLTIHLNLAFGYKTNTLIPHFERTLHDHRTSTTVNRFVIPEKWNPNLAKYMKKLENLETLAFNFAIINPKKKDSTKWFVETIKALTSLEKLRSLDIIGFEKEALKDEKQKIANALLEIPNIKRINIELYNDDDRTSSSQSKMEEAIGKVHARQVVRSDLMF